MIEIKGIHNTALVYTDALEPTAEAQIRLVCDHEAFKNKKIRIMPDVHAGKGCTIGTTMTIHDKVVPGMVGVDIGCGIETVQLAEKELDFSKLDRIIRKCIPAGRDIHKTPLPQYMNWPGQDLRCKSYVNMDRALRSIGTLGGGNHFIEVARGEDEHLYLLVHSGSRHIGLEVANFYQEEAFYQLAGMSRADLGAAATSQGKGRKKAHRDTLRRLKEDAKKQAGVPKDLAYVQGHLFHDYLHDMRLMQQYAALNRRAMVEQLLHEMDLTQLNAFSTTHNYIDLESMILRKGAVSAKKDEKLLIPINMRDGSFICLGKGNPDWNHSAPHGAGRLMSRRDALDSLSMTDYRHIMADVFSTCVNPATLDEAPMAYKHMDDILRHIAPTADVLMQLKPVYNFKAGE